VREQFLRALARLVIAVFYRNVDELGAHDVPGRGPILWVANHPNGLVDPILMAACLPRVPRFLAKSTLWDNPMVRPLLQLARSIPVCRQQDGAVDPGDNERTFAQCRAELAAGSAVAVFPEGISYHEPELQPLKTGAARIALGAEAEHGPLGLHIVPVGLTFERKFQFRSRALLQVGNPIDVSAFRTPQGARDREAVRELTLAIDAGLREVTLNFSSWEEAALVAQAAEVFAGGRGRLALRELAPLGRRFAEGYAALSRRDPARVARVVEVLRGYVDDLEREGLTDPEVRSDWHHARRRGLLRLLGLFAQAPLAAFGLLANFAPYQLVRRIARRVEHEPDQPASFKLLSSLVLYPLTWLGLGCFGQRSAGPWGGVLLVVGAPLCGWIAVRFLERAEGLLRATRAWLALARDPARFARLHARRESLKRDVLALERELASGA
jgi:1-acyl-sn-glycerol-3-phosphate acyltransferase